MMTRPAMAQAKRAAEEATDKVRTHSHSHSPGGLSRPCGMRETWQPSLTLGPCVWCRRVSSSVFSWRAMRSLDCYSRPPPSPRHHPSSPTSEW
jgi:hypothetical protein